jgi:serine/threonine protein kinase
MAHGNLRDFLMNREPVLSLVDKLYICYQVVCGLDHMVSQDIVHRDIAARNCLVGPNLVVKVADFGLSRSLAMSNYYKKVGGQVPIRWMSPESLKYGKYTPESDVWAFGVLMWEVYTEGHFPYSGYSNEEVQEMLDNGFKLHVPPHCTEDVSVLMQATWETDPADRPTFKTIRTRLNQMLRNSGMSNILYSSASPDSLPSTSTQMSGDATFEGSALMTNNNVRTSNFCQADTLTHAACFAGEGSSRTTCFLGEESSSGTITNTEIAINRYASEPGVITVETAL